MNLTNSQYDSIMRDFDAKRAAARRDAEERKEEIKKLIPEYFELSKEISGLSAEATRKAIMGDTAAKEAIAEQLNKLRAERDGLLMSHGYTADYLEPVYECNKCKDTGLIGNERCMCFKQASIDLLYNQSNLKKVLALENFEHFNYDWYAKDYVDSVTGLDAYNNIVSVVDRCKTFIDKFPNEDNILFQGATGVGKTFLSHCIAKELLDKGHSVLYLTADGLFEVFSKYTFHNDSEEDIREALSQVLECELLIIDDLGTEFSNSFTVSKLFYVISERIASGRSTVISTNLSLEGIRNAYSERVLSRIAQSYQFMKVIGEDIRFRLI